MRVCVHDAPAHDLDELTQMLLGGAANVPLVVQQTVRRGHERATTEHTARQPGGRVEEAKRAARGDPVRTIGTKDSHHVQMVNGMHALFELALDPQAHCTLGCRIRHHSRRRFRCPPIIRERLHPLYSLHAVAHADDSSTRVVGTPSHSSDDTRDHVLVPGRVNSLVGLGTVWCVGDEQTEEPRVLLQV